MEISGTTNSVVFTSSRDCSVDDELPEEQESGRCGDKMGGSSTSPWLKRGTVRREVLVSGLAGGGQRGNPVEHEGARRVKRSYPGIRSSENGTDTGVGFDLAEFSRRK